MSDQTQQQGSINFDTSVFQDVSKSVGQLCTQPSLTNISVPPFRSFSDVFDFLAEFESLTTSVSEEQKLPLLAKAFPPGRHRAWFETELSPLIKSNASWREAKNKLIQRFSDTEDRDRHFVRLRELKYNPDSGQKLLEFVEDMLYSYDRAYPLDKNRESAVRFVKAAIPESLKSTLGIIPEFRDATTEDMLKRAARQFDTSQIATTGKKMNDVVRASDLASIMKDVVTSIRENNEATRKAIVAAFNPVNNQKTYKDHHASDTRQYSRESSPKRNDGSSYHREKRSFSPNYRDRRSSSPRRQYDRYYMRKSEDTNRDVRQKGDSSPSNYKPKEAFDSKVYYAKFGIPETPCGAPVPEQNIIGLLNREPCLLVASFEIDGEIFPIIVDTGATISFIPENGVLMRRHRLKSQSANLNVKLADNAVTHIDKKVMVNIRPKDSREQPKLVPFYVCNGTDNILNHEVLIGLNHLKLFSLDIQFYTGEIQVYHNGRRIGQQYADSQEYRASISIDTRVDDIVADPQVSSILKRYKGVFTDVGPEPIRCKPMRIITVHPKPIFSKKRHYSPEERLQMKAHIQELYDKGIIEDTQSGYSATSRMVLKKSGVGRLVVNYIPLNAVTIRDANVSPHVQDLFGVIQGKKYFTTMDCAQGFYQILVDPRDRHKTAFSSPIGNFQFVRCPFGAKNSGAVFQATMNKIFSDGLYTRCVVYVDDILVFGKTREEHDENLAGVLDKCHEYNVKIKLEKCFFAQTEVQYLGFMVTGNSIKPVEDKISALKTRKPPTNKTELKSIIGKLNFYARFIPHYSKRLEPFRALRKKNKDFQWTSQHQKAYEKILDSLDNTASQMMVPRSTKKIIELHVMEDSIEILCLTHDEHLICRVGRFFSDAEANYCLVEKQLLALALALDKFKIVLEPTNFTVRVPTKELEKTIALVNRPERVESILLKMPCGFDEFKFEIKESLLAKSAKKNKMLIPQEIYYVDGACQRNGKPNCRASWAVCAEFDKELEITGLVDESPSNNSAEVTAAIKACELAKERGEDSIIIVTDSKYLHSAATLWIDKWEKNEWLDHKKKPVVNTNLFQQLLVAKKGLNIEWVHVKGHGDNPGNIRADMLARSVLDEHAEILCAATTSGYKLQANNAEIEKLKEQVLSGKVTNLIIKDDILYSIDNKLPESDQYRLYVPEDSRYWLLKLAHDDPVHGGHLGIKKTYRKLIRFWWPKMYRDVEYYLKSCDTCQRFKNPTGLPPGLLNSIPVSEVFEHIHIDIVGPIKRTHRGNAYIITATDGFSKWAYAKACQSIKTDDLIKFLEENIICIHGKPQYIITDRGVQFTSHEWKRFLDKMDIKHNLTTPYHPQSNGIDERLNGTLIRILRAYVNEYQHDWDEKLKWAVHCYNSTVHNSTGYSPYQILHGFDSRSPLKIDTTRKSTDIETISDVRSSIRQNAKSANERAQANQARLYDTKHCECQLEVGQLVLIREQFISSEFSKKLHPKWYGPCVVLGFVGSESKPRAVNILDCSDMKRKVISIRDVKPYMDRENKELLKEKSDGHPFGLDLQVEDELYDSKYYNIDTYTQNTTTNTFTPSIRQSTPLDITNFNEGCPVTSSPRRITFCDRVDTINYEPNETEIVEQTSDQTTMVHHEEQSEEPPRKSPYLVDFIIDNSTVDPTYKNPTDNIIESDRVTRSQVQASQPQLSIQNDDNTQELLTTPPKVIKRGRPPNRPDKPAKARCKLKKLPTRTYNLRPTSSKSNQSLKSSLRHTITEKVSSLDSTQNHNEERQSSSNDRQS